MNLTVIGLSLLAAFGAGGYAANRLTAMHYEHAISKAEREHAEAVDAANGRATDAAASFEKWKAAQRPRTITITREVEHAVQADTDCAGHALPDRLRDALTSAAAGDDQPLADGPVPSASSAGLGDLGGRRAGLFGRAARAGGLPAPAEGAR